MRTLNKNKQTLYHAEYQSETEAMREGLKTGRYKASYSDPVEEKMNISAARGSAEREMFGIETHYSKVAVTDNLNCSMDEASIVWIGKTPNTHHNYVVVRKAKSLNSISYALREVEDGE